MSECECSEEYGPCEMHGEVIAQREGASTRTADELRAVFVEDAQAAGVELAPWGQDVLARAWANLEANRSMGVAWLSEDAEGCQLSDDLETLTNQVETDLATMDAPILTYWEDGYRMVRIVGGPLSDEDEDEDELPEERNALQLANLADCYSPDSGSSAGAAFLLRVQDDVRERWAELDEDERADLSDVAHEVADAAVPIYTSEMWRTFVDLGAWSEDLDEIGGTSGEMEKDAQVSLYMIGNRLANVLLEELAEG